MQVLLTGGAGSIGQAVCRGLAEHSHRIRVLDLRPAPPGLDAAVDDWRVGNCLDPDVVDAAVTGVDAVVHLASNPSEADLASSLESHVLSTARLLDAMVRHGVDRIVYASSNHAVGLTRRDALAADGAGGREPTLGVAVPPRPDTHYGVAKVAAEALLQRGADRHGIATFAMRIGSFGDRPRTRRQLASWLSPADCVRMVQACLTSTALGSGLTGRHTVLYGISANSRGWWDLRPGHAIGYHPEDDAETFADQVPIGAEDDDQVGVVGGPFAGPAYDRPAFGAAPTQGRPSGATG